jgi:hypothetical protein
MGRARLEVDAGTLISAPSRSAGVYIRTGRADALAPPVFLLLPIFRF